MSGMFSDEAAGVFAAVTVEALRNELRLPKWAGRRLLLRELHGLSASTIFEGLFEGARTETVDTRPEGPAGPTWSMTAVVSDGHTDIIPYLIDDDGASTPNSGSGGFAASLRTHFLEGASRPRVLLILAENPQETIASTTEDISGQTSLSFERLCRIAALPGDNEPQPVRLIREVAAHYLELVDQSHSADWRDAELLRRWVADHRDDLDEDIGRSIPELGRYISDPGLRVTNARNRLKLGAKWYAELTGWSSSPGTDIAKRLARKKVGSAGIDAVLEARSVRGLDFGRISLALLQSRDRDDPLALDHVFPIDGALLALINGDAIAVWLPKSGGEIRFRLNRRPKATEGVRLRWRGAPAVQLRSRGAAAVASVAAPQSGNWRFGWLELLETETVAYRYPMAVAFSDEGRAAFEAALDIDPDLGAFNCGDMPQLAVWSSDGRQLGTASLDDENTSEDEGVLDVVGSFEGVAVGPVPVIPRRANDDEGVVECGGDSDVADGADGDRRDEVPAGDDEGDELGGQSSFENTTGSGRGVYPAAAAEQPTLAHAMLAFRRPEWPEGASTPSSGEISARYDAVKLSVIPRAGTVNLLQAEKAILEHPEWCMYSVDGVNCSPLREFPRAETFWNNELQSFLEARARFFAAALRAGSTYALDPRSQEASDYTSSYRRLLDKIPRDGTSRSEYDDLLLIDRVDVRGLSDVLIAPTAPLSVAWHAELAHRFADLAAADPIDKADRRVFDPQHVLPLLMNDGDWYESRPSPEAILWRRYMPLATNSPGSMARNAEFIATRIAFFLSVHPTLNRPETTLAVTFSDPGDGEVAIDALRAFFRSERQSSAYRRPRIRAVLAGADERTSRSIETLIAGAADNDVDRIVRTRSDLVLTEELEPPSFSSIAFLFRSPAGRGVRPVRLDHRAPTTFGRGVATSLGRVQVPDADFVFATGTFCAHPSNEATDLEAIQHRCLELVGGQGGERLEPGWTRMIVATASEADLAPWYDQSAWVVHLDRLVGLEAFAGSNAERTLLEYEECADPSTFGYDGITGTRYIQPYLAALRRALSGFASPTSDEARALMRLLEAVSGRWALQIVQRPMLKVLERAGTTCAVRYLSEIERGLAADEGTIAALVSLEEIAPGFPEVGIPRRLIASRAGRGAMCDDLLLLSVRRREGLPPLVQATVVEVKFFRTEAADYSDAADQVEETISWLRARFVNAGAVADIRGRDLAELIRSAATRNSTFGISPLMSQDAEVILESVSRGDYEMSFGHWRQGIYRRGLVVAAEYGRSGNMELTQLNTAEGPLDLINLRSDFSRDALEMKALATPLGWSRLTMVPPGDYEDRQSGTEPSPQPDFGRDGGEYNVSNEISRDARRLDDAFAKYGLTIEPFQPELAQVGPSVIRFRTRIIGRLSITDIERRARDIGREVGAPGEISIGDEPGRITVDVPRAERQSVPLAVALSALDKMAHQPGALSFVAGVAPSGEVQVADLARLPHLLVSGATGSGKSVFLRGMLLELLRARTPQQLRLMIIDPKRLDFAPFTSSPHLEGGRIISDPSEALSRLTETLEGEINRRQPILEGAGVSSATEFYESGGALDVLPQLVILVDEFADLILAGSDRRTFSELVQRYAQLTRAYGIYLVLATQRPSVDVITGSIKANLSARIAFSLPSARDSMTILDRGGAESLLGNGDLLFYRNGKIERLQAPFATLNDVRAELG